MSVWTTPTTRSTGLLVTAAIWNTDIVENLKYLKDSPVFDGSPVVDGPALGIGVTPSGWGTSNDLGAVQITGGALWATGSSQISVGQNYYYNGMLTLYRTSAAASEYKQSGGVHTWSTASSGTAGNVFSFTERMRLDNSGNVGIGVTPGSWNSSYKALQIGQSSFMSRTSGDDAYLNANAVYGASNWTYVNSSFASRFEMSSGKHSFFTAPSGTAGNTITWTERFRITSGGDVAIGATARLYLDGVGGTGDTYIVESSANALDLVAGGINIIRCTTTGALINNTKDLTIGATAKFYLDGGGDTYIEEYAANEVRLTVGGAAHSAFNSTGQFVYYNPPTTASAANAYIAQTDYIKRSTSSIRYKHDIATLDTTDALSAVMAMRPVTYRGKTDEDQRRFIGFIAEEMQEIAPLLCTYDEGGESGTPNYVTYDRVTAYLVAVVQQQQTEINALKARIH